MEISVGLGIFRPLYYSPDLLWRWRAGWAGGSFSRSSPAWYVDRDGILREVGPDVPRIDWSHGRPALRLEGSSTNLLLDSCNLPASGSAWGGAADFTVSPAVSIFAGQTAWRHQNLGLVDSRRRSQTIGTFTGQPETASAIVENVNATETALNIRDSTTATNVCLGRLSWATGQASVQSGTGTVIARKLADAGPNGGPVYRLIVTATGTAGNTRALHIYPSGTSQNTQTVIVHHMQHETVPVATSPIVTTTAAVTRSADVLTFPWPHAPQPMTLYVRMVEVGGVLAPGFDRVVEIGSGANRIRIQVEANLDRYQIRYDSGGQMLFRSASAQPAPGQVVELMVPLSESGARLVQAIDGGSPAQTSLAALPLPTTWGTPTLTIGGGGQFDLLDLIVLRGAGWTMDQVRAYLPGW